MKHRRAGILLGIALALTLPAIASAIPIHHHVKRTVRLPETGALETVTVTKVVHVAPSDRDEDGVADRDDECPKTAGPDNGCPLPPPAPEPVVASTSYAPPATSSGGCPSYMAGEASSPDAVNPVSGAAGCFQIIPSTQAAFNCAAPDAACAAAICAEQGDDAWDAADPCAYLGTEP